MVTYCAKCAKCVEGGVDRCPSCGGSLLASSQVEFEYDAPDEFSTRGGLFKLVACVVLVGLLILLAFWQFT